MRLVFEQIRGGGDRNLGYLLGDRETGTGVLIDPSYSPDAFVDRAEAQGLHVDYLINTHSHPDHTNGNARVLERTHARLAAHRSSPLQPVERLDDGTELALGSLRLGVLHVPGHCPDHITLYEPTRRLLITGDLLFVGKVGGTATDEDARAEWQSLQRLLARTPNDATVWPGHDYGARPSSTIALERETNPFLQCADLAAFLQLKAEWPELKRRLGLR